MLQVATVLPAAATGPTTYTVNSNSGTSCSTGGSCSLSNAIADANGTPSNGPFTVNFAPGTATYTDAPYAITAAYSMTINGNGAGTTILDGGALNQVFNIGASDGPITIQNLTIQRGHSVDGAGIENDGSLNLSGVTILNNTAVADGGGIYNDNLGVLSLTGVTIGPSNTATHGNGGGIDNLGIVTTSTTTPSTVFGNLASSGTSDGGGIANESGGSLTATGLVVDSNAAGQNGGGIANESGAVKLALTNGNIGAVSAGNRASGTGGGLYNDATTITTSLSGVSIAYNSTTFSATSDGGGIENLAPLLVTGGSISNNIAKGVGGGLYNDYTPGPMLTGAVSITSNTALSGGGIYDDASGGGLSMTGGALSSNTATATVAGNGGGAYIDATSGTTDTFTGVTVDSNTAHTTGGGFFLIGGALVLSGTTVSRNVATFAQGGGVYLDDPDPGVCSVPFLIPSIGMPLGAGSYDACIEAGSVITSNSSPQSYGGGTTQDNGSLEIIASTVGASGVFGGNSAHTKGGGVYDDGSPITIVNSMITGNAVVGNTGVQDGGGIYGGAAANAALLYYSTVMNNTTTPSSATTGLGNGIYSPAGEPLFMVDDTVYGNLGGSEGGGLYDAAGDTLTNVTISGNQVTQASEGAGLFATATTTLTGTILAGDQDFTFAGYQDDECDGTPPADGLGFNLDSDHTCGLLGPGDVSGAVADFNNGGVPQDNGVNTAVLGANALHTLTISLGPLSDAIGNEHTGACPLYDERGDARNATTRGDCDSGAFDTGGVPAVKPVPVVTTGVSSGSVVAGTSVTYTVTITGADGPPTGTPVNVSVGAVLVCSVTTLTPNGPNSSTGNCTSTTAPVGTNELVTAAFPGDATYGPANGGTATITVTSATTVPGAPTNLVATPGNGQASFTWSAPASNGGSAILSYTVTCLPSGSATVSGTSVTITGLTNGTTYTCTVAATNANGTGPSSASAAVTPGKSATTTVVSVSPTSVAAGATVTYSATVTGGPGTPTGSVTFTIGGNTMCTILALVGGVGSCTSALAPVGQDLTVTGTYSGDSTHSASSGSALLTVGGLTCLDQGYTGNAAFVCQVFVDLLGRLPSSAEDASWVSAIAGGLSRTQVGLEIAQSQEYRNDLVNNYYKAFLGRQADPGGLAFWVGLLNGGTPDSQVLAGILGSNEFYTNSGGTAAGFVTALYHDLLNRAPDPGGLSFWESELAGGTSTAGVAYGILTSPEYLSDFVAAQYIYLLGRPVDPVGLAFWVSILQTTNSYETVIAGIIGSNEYYTDATT